MLRLTSSTTTIRTDIYTYNNHEELEKHFDEMQANGWVGSFVGTTENSWVVTYTKRSLEMQEGNL